MNDILKRSDGWSGMKVYTDRPYFCDTKQIYKYVNNMIGVIKVFFKIFSQLKDIKTLQLLPLSDCRDASISHCHSDTIFRPP